MIQNSRVIDRGSIVSKQICFATWLRAFGAMLILLCHFTSQCDNPYISMSSQMFNIGVEIFFILSGFLFGVRGIRKPYGQWYLKRVKRIYVPYEMFVIFLAAIYTVFGMSIATRDWLLFSLGAQGSIVGVWGAEQTWFISALLICYIVTPALVEALERSSRGGNRCIISICCIAPILLALIKEAYVFTLFSPVFLYALAYMLGKHSGKVKLTKKTTIAAFVLLCAAFMCRFIVRLAADGTILYDRIIVGYTQSIAAFCILFIFAKAFETRQPTKFVQTISDISFELYLYHYMFVVGPISLFGKTPSWGTDCILAAMVSVGIAWMAHRFLKIARSLSWSKIKE